MSDITDTLNPPEELILRDYLALERTKLANVRTLFSYIRMSFYLLTVGIGTLQIQSISHLDGLAWACILSGILLFFSGFILYFKIRKRLKGYTGNKRCQDKMSSPSVSTN